MYTKYYVNNFWGERQMEEKKNDVHPEKTPESVAELPALGENRRHPPKKRRSRAGWLLILALLLAAMIALCYVNEFSVAIALTGDSEMLLEYGDAYQEPGAKVVLKGKYFLRDGFPLKDISVSSTTNLQEEKLGRYLVEYSAEVRGSALSAQRWVRVVDLSAPVITLLESGQPVMPGQVYQEEGYIAVDNYDGNVTGRVQRVEGLDTVTYTVMDSSGNPATVVRKIPYHDPVPPVITLNGEEYMDITCGTVYTEPGFSAQDNADGDMTKSVTVEGNVVWYVPGTYQLVYTVTDACGNVDQKIRTVEVQAVARPEVVNPNRRTIYLTFDDGPSEYTMGLLDLLEQYDVKATFFVTGSGSNGELWRMHKSGHSIGIHTLSHDYDAIYASEEAYFEDLNAVQDIIYRETGEKTTLLRFPGGGSNLASNFNRGIMTRLAEAVQNAGFQYFDWNVDSDDAGDAMKTKTVVENVIEGIREQRVSVVLQHDIHGFSVQAVEEIIVWGLENGYQFLPLTPNSPPMHHDILN